MTQHIASIITAANGADPLTLAIVFIGLVSLAAIWLASVAIKSGGGKGK